LGVIITHVWFEDNGPKSPRSFDDAERRSRHLERRERVDLGLFVEAQPGRIIPRCRSSLRDEAIADPGFGLDVLLAGLDFEFLAQLADEDAQVFGLMGD